MSVSEALLPQPEAGIGCTFLNDELKTFTHYLLPFLPLGQRLAGVRSPTRPGQQDVLTRNTLGENISPC